MWTIVRRVKHYQPRRASLQVISCIHEYILFQTLTFVILEIYVPDGTAEFPVVEGSA